MAWQTDKETREAREAGARKHGARILAAIDAACTAGDGTADTFYALVRAAGAVPYRNIDAGRHQVGVAWAERGPGARVMSRSTSKLGGSFGLRELEQGIRGGKLAVPIARDALWEECREAAERDMAAWYGWAVGLGAAMARERYCTEWDLAARWKVSVQEVQVAEEMGMPCAQAVSLPAGLLPPGWAPRDPAWLGRFYLADARPHPEAMEEVRRTIRVEPRYAFAKLGLESEAALVALAKGLRIEQAPWIRKRAGQPAGNQAKVGYSLAELEVLGKAARERREGNASPEADIPGANPAERDTRGKDIAGTDTPDPIPTVPARARADETRVPAPADARSALSPLPRPAAAVSRELLELARASDGEPETWRALAKAREIFVEFRTVKGFKWRLAAVTARVDDQIFQGTELCQGDQAFHAEVDAILQGRREALIATRGPRARWAEARNLLGQALAAHSPELGESLARAAALTLAEEGEGREAGARQAN